MSIAYVQRLSRARRFFWMAFVIFVGLLGSVIWGAHRYFGDQMDPTIDPIFKGAPQFIVLSLVVAFAVYLRQVSTNASELRDKIRKGEVWNYPLGATYTDDKMQALDGTCEKINITAPFMVLLTLAAAGRVVFDALLKFPRFASLRIYWVLFLVDLGIALWVFFLFLALAIFHTKGRWGDEKIRLETRAKEDDCLINQARSLSPNPVAGPRVTTPRRVHPWNRKSHISGVIFVLAFLLLASLPRHK